MAINISSSPFFSGNNTIQNPISMDTPTQNQLQNPFLGQLMSGNQLFGGNANSPLTGVAPPNSIPNVESNYQFPFAGGTPSILEENRNSLNEELQEIDDKQIETLNYQGDNASIFQNYLDTQANDEMNRIDRLVKPYLRSGNLADLLGKNYKKNKLSADMQAANAQAEKLAEAGIVQDYGYGQALETLSPYQILGQRGLEQASFLGDPQAQHEFLQNNPLYQASLDNANRATLASSAADGRLSSGTTLQDLSNNTLLAAQPLLDAQRQDILSQLGIGSGISSGIADLQIERGLSSGNILGQIGDVQASGIVGYKNRQDARKAASDAKKSSALGAIASVAAAFAMSDERLKENIQKIGKIGDFNKYKWKWNKIAEKEFGKSGYEEGVIAQEVERLRPELIITGEDGFKRVNYGGLL